jgi:hypothetical protein
MRIVTVALFLIPSGIAAGQLPPLSARAMALGGSLTGIAIGFEALAWNPALLAAPARPARTFGFVQGERLVAGQVFGWDDLQRFHSRDFAPASRLGFLAGLGNGGGDSLRSFGFQRSLGAFAMTIGNFGASLSFQEAMAGSLTPRALELALFDNVARTDPAAQYPTARSALLGWSSTTLALGYAVRLPVDALVRGALTAGVTLKINRALTAVSALDFGPATSSAPAPTVGWVGVFNRSASLGTGTGFGLDFGLSYQATAALRFGAAFENILSDPIAWNDSRLSYTRMDYRRAATGSFMVDSVVNSIRNSAIPEGVSSVVRTARDSLNRLGHLPKRLRLGVNQAGESYSLTAGIVIAASGAGGIGRNPGGGVRINLPHEATVETENLGVGLEWRGIPFLTLRGGAATDGRGAFTLGGGVGLKVAWVRLDLSGAITPRTAGATSSLAAGVVIIR